MKIIKSNGAKMPAIGFGTWTLDDGGAEAMVSAALETGYRHIDTAAMYANEAGVGAAIAAANLDRDEVFVTTKIWHDQLNEGALQASIAQSLDKLKLDSVDLALIHWPPSEVPLAETMAALNDAKATGMTKHIGVANFTSDLIHAAVACSDAPLVSNQIEYHAMLDQSTVVAACEAHGIAITAYCPLAQGQTLLTHPAVVEPAMRLGVSPGQVALHWIMCQENVAAIPRTSQIARLALNLDVFDLGVTPEEMSALDALKSMNMRVVNPEFSPVWDAN